MVDIKAESAKGNDLRIRKTQGALYSAMFTLLNRRNFNNITVHDLCTEALVSRAAFYSHFRDKYDLLEYILSVIRNKIVANYYKYDELEQQVNQFVHANSKLLSNIIREANSETLSIVRTFMSYIVEHAIKETGNKAKSRQNILLVNFLTGGLVNLLRWIDESGYPPNITLMNPYVYNMLEYLIRWDAEQDNPQTHP